MKPIPTPDCNVTFKAEGCQDLPARVEENPTNGQSITTFWALSDAERTAVLQGGVIVSTTWSKVQPPMLIEIGLPLDHTEENTNGAGI